MFKMQSTLLLFGKLCLSYYIMNKIIDCNICNNTYRYPDEDPYILCNKIKKLLNCDLCKICDKIDKMHLLMNSGLGV